MLNPHNIETERNTMINLINGLHINIFDTRIRENNTIYASSMIPINARNTKYYKSQSTTNSVLTELENLTNEFIIKAGI